MYVCHRWHDVVLAAQPLWAVIHVGWSRGKKISRLYRQLKLSGVAPITLRMELYRRYYTPVIMENSKRIRSLKVRGEAKDVYELISALPHYDFPILRSLNLDPSYKRDELPEGSVEALPDEIFNGRMPSLRELVLTSIAVSWSSLRGLYTLCLTCRDDAETFLPHTFDALLAMLGACPQLRILKLDHVIPPPLPAHPYPTVDLPSLEWIRLHDDATTCTVVLNHLRFPPATSVHIFPYGVRAGPDVRDLLVPIRKHLRAPAALKPCLVRIEGSPGLESSYFTTSMFHDAGPPDGLDNSKAYCPFTLNSHPANEGALRQIMTKVFKAVPVESITHFDARGGMALGEATWKAALRLLPALEMVYLTLSNGAISFLRVLNEVEQRLDPAHRTFPLVRRLYIRLFSRARWRNHPVEGEAEEHDLVPGLLLALQAYLEAAHSNGNTLEALEFDDQDWCLGGHEGQMDALFPLIKDSMTKDSMIWDGEGYNPIKRKDAQEAWQAERRALEAELGIDISSVS
ncbi:hypothetical protein C8R44DRAFT_803806 [Mycena epipterygia]|nr:hypothetical protein C8R44DRAFT_803806 [Mycena epipterygia]